MKAHRIIALASITTVVHAGTVPEAPVEAPPETDPWIKPTLNIRARFEYGDTGGLQSSKAFTTRERVGLMTREMYGFSALVEGEFTQAIVDDYAISLNQPGVTPFNPGQTNIDDPETNELNQAWIQWKGYDTAIKAGRQRIILDNANFIGNVGWRQNEQTYDGISLTNESVEGLTLFYSYLNRANRIFGSDASFGLRSFAGDIHLFNARYEGIENTSLTAYAYLMDFDKTAAPIPGGAPPAAPGTNYLSNNTFGGIASTKLGDWAFRAEAAYQTDADSTAAFVDDSNFFHFNVDYTGFEGHTFGLGWAYLDQDFVQPLSTAHAFNGFADVFLGRQVGVALNPGLNDVYVSHKWKTPFWGINFAQWIHCFGDNDTQFDFGWEYNAVVSKKFNENFTALAKFAYYDSAGTTGKPVNTAPLFDTTRVSVELNYTF